jgi:Tol biopolymer transport system component
MTDRERNQADLLDGFVRDHSAVPTELDAGIAAISVQLAAELTPPEPSARFVRQLDQQLTAGPAASSNNHQAVLPAVAGTELTPQTALADWREAAVGPRRSRLSELARLAAAVLAIMLIGSVLIYMFSDRDDALAPGVSDIPNLSRQILVAWDPHDGEDYKLFIVNADTGEIHKLTPGPAEVDGVSERYGSWSPDGQHIAFVRMESGEAHLLVSRAAGGEPLDLSAETGISDVSAFSWSPDGTQLAARGQNTAGAYGIHIINANGSGASVLIADGDSTANHLPAWSPDGRQVAFIRSEGRSSERVYVVDIDELNAMPITDEIGAATLRWSPDSSRIAVTAGRIRKSVLVMNADGSGLQRLIHPEAVVLSPAQWSPDGNTLAFAFSDPALPGEYVMDGTVVARLDGLWRPLTEIAGVPEWSPDGTQVTILTSGITEQGMNTHQSSLYLVNQDGSNLYPLLEDVSLAYDPPVWRPVSDPIEPQPASTPTPQVVLTPVDQPSPTPDILTEPPRASLTYADQTQTHGAHTYCWPESLRSGEMRLTCSEADRGPPDLPAIHVPAGASLSFEVEGGHAFAPLGAAAVRLIPYPEPSTTGLTFDFPGTGIPFEQGPGGTFLIADVPDGDYSFEVGITMDIHPGNQGNANYAFRVIVGDPDAPPPEEPERFQRS